MKIAFNPSTVAALITPPNNKDITFDLRGRNIFARGVKFCGTDTWRDIKINNVSIDSNILDLRNGSNTTLTNTNGVVTINSTWRPVVDNLTSDSTTSSLSAKQGKILKSLIDGKSNSGHTHDDRYLRLTGGIMQLGEGLKFHADNNYFGSNADARIISLLDNNDKICDGGLIIDERATLNGKEYVTELLRIRDSEFKWKGSNILHSGNTYVSNNKGYINNTEITLVNNSDTVDGYHASSLVKFYLSPMTSNAPADSAKSWFINTMPSSSGAIVYNVPGKEKTIIAGKSSGAHGHMLQLNYDDTYLRILRYYSGSWKSTDWEKISAGYADSAGSVAWANVTGKPSSFTPSAHTHAWNSLTHSSTTENQAILTNGKANGWKLYTLNISRWDNAANNAHSHSNKSVLDGITSALVNNWNTAYTFVNTITGTDTDKIINKWDEIVNFLAGITEDNKLNTLLNSKLSVYELANNTNVGAIKNNGIYYSTTDASSGTLTNSPFNTGFSLINMTSYDGGDDLRRSRLAFNAYGEIKVSDDRDLANTAETWYNVLTSKNSGISGSTIKLNGTSITVYSSSTADGRYVKRSGDTMSGTLTTVTTGSNSYNQGIRINRTATNQWATLLIGKSGTATTGTGTSTAGDGAWLIATPASSNSLIFNLNSASETVGLCLKGHGNTDIKWNNNTIWHAGNDGSGSGLDADTVDGEHASNFSYTHQTSFDFSKSKSGRIVTFDQNNTDYGWINGFASTHYNYLTSVLFNTHRTSNWYVGYIEGNTSTGKTDGLLAVHKLAFVDLIPTSLKNPYALTISLNGTSLGPYDGSAAKNINITPSSIGAATSGHNHDSSYVKYTKVTKSTADNANATPYLYNVENEEVISGYYKYWYIFNMGQYSGGNFGTLIAMPYQDSLTDSELFIRSAKSGSWRTWRRILHSNNYASILDSRYYTKSEVNTKLGTYLSLSGGTVTGNIILKGGTSADMTYTGNVHPYIRFDNSDSSLNVSLIFTDYDTYRRPAGIKLVGNQGNEWFETANIYATTFYGTLSGNASSANKLTTARNIALGTDLRGSANFDGSSNITISANINACTVQVSSTNGLPFKRIAHFETGSSWNDNALLLYISLGYINGSNGICRVEFRTDNISSSSTSVTASAAVRWLVRNGYGLDSLYAGYYVTTSKAYIDIYLKTTGSYQGTVIRVLLDSRGGINSNVLLINSYYYSDTNHKEAYNSIEAASTALYNRAYTRIVSGSDVGTVSYSNSTGSVHWNNVTNKPSTFSPAAHTHTVFNNNLMIKGTNGISDSASIHLGIGDSDTGFKWISDGKCLIYANNVAVGEWTSGGMNWFKNPTVNGNKVWNAGNDGSGSGLDADTVDGYHASKFPYINNNGIWRIYGNAAVAALADNTAGLSSWAFGESRNYGITYLGILKPSTDTCGINAHGTIAVFGQGDTHLGIASDYGSANLQVFGGNADKIVWRKKVAFTDSNVASATKLQTARTIWGHSFNGTADVNGTIYINNSNSSEGAIRLNNNVNSNARISAIDSQVIFNTDAAIRFGGTSWDWNVWAGLKYNHSNKTIYLGIADNSIFNANSALSGGSLRFPGISNVYAPTFNGNLSGNASTATNADKVDGYHASSLWRSDGATWNPGANVSLNASANNQEWSFDIRRNGYTGCYWHVWDSTLNSMLKVNADNGKVYAPYNFVGNLEGNASSSSKWLTARTFTIGNTSKNVDGSSNVSWSLSEIGAASSSHSHNYAANENYGGFTKSGRLPISGFYQSNESESGGNAPWSGWMHLINCLHSNTGNNYALLIAASFYDNNTFKIRVTNNNVNNTWRDIIHSGNIGSQTVANAYHLRINSANTWSTWNWSGLSGQPSWLWGSNDGTNMYVWNPSNFRVAYASSAGNADTVDGYHETAFPRLVGIKGNTWNWNDVIRAGYYKIQSGTITNHPSGIYPFGMAEVITTENHNDGENRELQIYYPHSQTNNIAIWLRMHNSSTQGNGWGSWVGVPNTNGNIASATKLQTPRTIWGQRFDGTANVDNTLRIRQTTGNYCEGIRIQTADSTWATIVLGATGDSGTNANAWSIHRKSDNNFAISRNSSDGTNGLVMTSVGMGLGTTAPTQRLDVHGNIRATGQIIREGSSLTWVNGRRGALLRETTSTGYHTLWSLKTTNGSWDFGEYNSSGWNNIPVLSYITDTNFNSGNNTTTYQIRFPLDSGTIALTKNIPTSLKSPYSLTLKANGTTLATYDGSSAKEANFTYANVGAASASHTHDDRYVRAFGTSNDNIDSDWGLSFKTFDPIPSGTPPEKNPNISILNIGNSFNRRKLLAFIYSNDNIYYRRHVDNSFTNWRRLAFANEIPTSLPANGGNADTIDGTHLNGIFTAFGNNAHNITATIGGVTKSFLVNWAADSDKLDGYHANGLLTALSNTNNGISITVGGTTKSVSNISVNYANSAGSAGSATKVIVNLHTTNDTNYPLVWSNLNNTNNVTENQLYKSWSDLYYNPKNKRLTVGGSVVASSFVKSGGTSLQLLRADGGIATFNWSGQSGLPTWLWGGNNEHSYYVYNPSNFRVAYATSSGNADTVDGEHAKDFVRAGFYENNNLNSLDTYSFIRSVNSQVSSTSPKGDIGWYNVILLVHRNGDGDGPNYIGLIALGMTSNVNDIFFRCRRTDPWKTIIHSNNYTEFINNYYWANVKISTSSSTTTSPTVHTLTATRVCAGYNPEIDNSISCSNWFRSSGDTGWYNATYLGGWYMSDTSWIRAHNGVGIYTSGQIYSSSSIRMGNIYLQNTNEINSASGIHLNYQNSGNISLCVGGGNVGIGTGYPSYKLDVNGLMRASGFHHSSMNSDNYILLAGGGYKSFGGDYNNPIFLGYLNLDHGNNGTISSSFSCLGYTVPFTYTRGGNYCKISIPNTTHQAFYIKAATASVNYSGGGMDTWTGDRRGSGAWWLHCYASSLNEVRVKGFYQGDTNNDSWWGGNPLWSEKDGANRITVCIFGYVIFK